MCKPVRYALRCCTILLITSATLVVAPVSRNNPYVSALSDLSAPAAHAQAGCNKICDSGPGQAKCRNTPINSSCILGPGPHDCTNEPC